MKLVCLLAFAACAHVERSEHYVGLDGLAVRVYRTRRSDDPPRFRVEIEDPTERVTFEVKGRYGLETVTSCDRDDGAKTLTIVGRCLGDTRAYLAWVVVNGKLVPTDPTRVVCHCGIP